MAKNFKIRNGGIYLVNFGKTIGAEFTSPHYCVVLKTHDKELVMVFPITSKSKFDKYACIIKEYGTTCLLKHTKTISIKRVLKPLHDNNTGEEIIVSTNTLEQLISKYKEYVYDTCKNALIGNSYINNEQQNNTTIVINNDDVVTAL